MSMTTAGSAAGTVASRVAGTSPAARTTGDPVARALGELPVLTPVRQEHLPLAVRAVVVHAPQEWPAGPVCRNDRSPYPCRLARWGRGVLAAAGVAEDRVESLIAAGDPYASPWA
ncbi:hypothetical protein AB0J86_10080 [Micromonospora sp. NPDC049559]|uniref:hypothetical protein n=1 Tax=Micromonospora sp. NPDC049559 TaxID=3155923 RepID=UPI00344608E2